MKILLGLVVSIVTIAASATDLSVYRIGGFRLYCDAESNVGRAGFAISGSAIAQNGGQVTVSVDLVQAQCQSDMTWATSNPWSNFSYERYDAETETNATVTVQSRRFRLNVMNPAGVTFVGFTPFAEQAQSAEMTFTWEDYLTEEQKNALTEGPLNLYVMAVINAQHEISDSTGISVGPFVRTNAEVYLPVTLERIASGYQVVQ